MRMFVRALGLVTLTGVCGWGASGLLREASAATSQVLCGSVFISGFQPDDAFRKQLRPEPGMGLIAWALHYDIDRERREVRTRVLGGFGTRSVFRPGRGCTLAAGEAPPAELRAPPPSAALLAEIAGPTTVVPSDPRLRAAIDAAFAEPRQRPPRATAAVVILHKGRVIGERYAPGYGPDVPLWSHSLAKSLVNALIGVLVRDGALDVARPAPVAEWSGSKDPRAAITVDQLLRMDAGFGFDEGRGSSIATRIYYTQPDTAHAAASARLLRTPGTEWGYSSRGYMLLSRIAGDAAGGGPRGLNDFAHRQIFDPLGMHTATLEFDAAGTMMGAHSVMASPRDWARFALLYLNDGVVAGKRILPSGWVRYSTTPTLNTGYGAGFWLNNTSREMPKWGFRWGIPGAPPGAFMARGYLGQYVVIVPSEDLVVVRFGYSRGRGAEIESVGRLVRDVIATLHSGTGNGAETAFAIRRRPSNAPGGFGDAAPMK